MLEFSYFQGPAEDMAGLVEGERQCSLCGGSGVCFELDFAICDEFKDEEKEGKFGCVNCLKSGRFEFWHDTDVGVLDKNGLTKAYNHNKVPSPDFPDSALTELRRTPQFLTWQQELWLTHCNDFMVYQGTWEPKDFYQHSTTGDGRALFYEMTEEWQNLWDDSLPQGETILKEWYATYYVFKCRRCNKLRGNWDCD